jgi:hypothetical protein
VSCFGGFGTLTEVICELLWRLRYVDGGYLCSVWVTCAKARGVATQRVGGLCKSSWGSYAACGRLVQKLVG